MNKKLFMLYKLLYSLKDAKYLNGTLEEENQRLHREVNLLQLKIELLTDIVI